MDVPDDGSMTPVDREAALAKIRNSDDVKVILISFKAGSTGALLRLVYLFLIDRFVPRSQSHRV